MSRRRTAALALLLAVSAMAGAARAGEDTAPKISGTVAYRERIALPPGAVVHVRLETLSSPELPARLVAEISVPTEGKQAPIPFELPYEASAIHPQQRYLVRATITAGGRTLFVTRSAYPAITRGAPTKLEIQVQQAGEGRRPRPATSSSSAGAELSGTSWRLVKLGEAPALALPEERAASLVFDGGKKRISGSTGCNHFMGTYAPGERGALKLEPAGMTMMACPDDVTAQERAFLEALRGTTDYRIEERKLDLLAGDRVLAQFQPSAGAEARTE